jgi:hypothetical protein
MKLRRLANDHPLASIGDALGITLYVRKSDGKIVYKTRRGVITEVMDASSTTITTLQSDMTTAQTDINNLETFQELVAPANKATGPITIEVAITEANILVMNGTPVEVVAAQGADTAIEFISATLIYDYDTAAYTGGGDVSIEYSGGSTISTTVAAANSFGAAGDKVYSMAALNAAGGYSMLVNTGLDITNATGAFVDPGTAAGVARLQITYRVHTLGL